MKRPEDSFFGPFSITLPDGLFLCASEVEFVDLDGIARIDASVFRSAGAVEAQERRYRADIVPADEAQITVVVLRDRDIVRQQVLVYVRIGRQRDAFGDDLEIRAVVAAFDAVEAPPADEDVLVVVAFRTL